MSECLQFIMHCPDCHLRYPYHIPASSWAIRCKNCERSFSLTELRQLRSFLGGIGSEVRSTHKVRLGGVAENNRLSEIVLTHDIYDERYYWHSDENVTTWVQ